MLYFAYGSNMYTQRLQRRVPSATKVAAVSLPGYELSFHKVGEDGSGKCTIKKADGSTVYGIIYEIDGAEKEDLDRIEGPGYKVAHLQIDRDTESDPMQVYTYQARENYIDPAIRPYSWYKSLVVAGAEEHNLPQEYINAIRQTKSIRDPNAARAGKERNIL